MKTRLTRAAIADVAAIKSFVSRENSQAAANIVAHVYRQIQLLSHFPEMGQATDLDGVRRIPVGRYPYIVYYEVLNEEVIVHHIRHAARRPWSGHR